MHTLKPIWPYVGKRDPDKALEDDLKKIDTAFWGENTASFLDEARRERDFEMARVRTAETKSQVYIAALLILIPFLFSVVEKVTINGAMGSDASYSKVGLFLFCLGLFFGFSALYWAFRALKVSGYNRVDVAKLGQKESKEDSLGDLTKEVLKSIRRDRENVNHKISFILATEKHMRRMVSFVVLAIVWVSLVDYLEIVWISLVNFLAC